MKTQNRFAALEQLYQDRVVAAKYRQKIDTQKKTTEKYRLPENRTDRIYLTPDERKKHLRQGLCFKCHKKGHRSMDHKDGFIAKEDIRSTPASQENDCWRTDQANPIFNHWTRTRNCHFGITLA